MAMKCPNCGKETSEDRFFCGWCNAKLREPTPSTDSPTYRSEPESSSQMELDDRSLGRTVSKAQMVPLIRNDFLRMVTKIFGIFSAIFGAILAIVAAYAIAGGSGVTFTINDRVVSTEEGGPIFLVIGLVLLFVGFALRYAYHKAKPEKVYSPGI
jgi:hypothetical protein